MKHLAIIIALAAIAPTFSQSVFAQDEPLTLDFDLPLERMKPRTEPLMGVWQYYITKPKVVRESISDSDEVKRYVIGAPNGNKKACQLLSRQNFVGVSRLVDPGYEDAKRLTWKWAVNKHPHNGTLGGKLNDHAAIVYVFFGPLQNNSKYQYTALGFCWLDKEGAESEQTTARMTWNNSPKCLVTHLAKRTGRDSGTFSETVDLESEYRRAFSTNVPPIWAIAILADSNVVAPDVGEMTTDAVFSEIRFHDKTE